MDAHDSNENRNVKPTDRDTLTELEAALKKFRRARRRLQHELK